MEFIADFHIHSHYARATSHDLTFPELYRWAHYKGIHVIGTGDFTHPGWIGEMEECLQSAPEEGLYRLKPEVISQLDALPVHTNQTTHQVRFLMTTEISTIYKKHGKTRKVHTIVCAPSLEVVKKIRQELLKIGNLDADGRPILGLDCKHLLEILLAISPQIYLIPAHIWTPWFSILGAASGFDDVTECFEELTPYIFALETGLSSDPAMNWLCSRLDRFALVSNSDAHSCPKLGREANLFDTELSYPAIFAALQEPQRQKFLGTIEFYPEEGKYHLDGHRQCSVRLTPEETQKYGGQCPQCGKSLTIGVMHRVSLLADRQAGEKPPKARPYQSLVPLEDVLAEILGVGPASKKVDQMYQQLLRVCGPELEILRRLPLADLQSKVSPLFAEAVRRIRSGELDIQAGYDGEFGKIGLFRAGERDQFASQTTFFTGWGASALPATPKRAKQGAVQLTKNKKQPAPTSLFVETTNIPESQSNAPADVFSPLNPEQLAAVTHRGSPLLVVAGPGTGKTKTLISRILHLLLHDQIAPHQILAITFTNKAAEELGQRLAAVLPETQAAQVLACTFHRLGLAILQEHAPLIGLPAQFAVYDPAEMLPLVAPKMKITESDLEKISLAKSQMLTPEAVADPTLKANYLAYQEMLHNLGGVDLDDLITLSVRLIEQNSAVAEAYRQRWRVVAVDEYQDINFAQYRLLKALVGPLTDFCAIGDPDQAIYGFRGADVRYFFQFTQDFPNAREVRLADNYRSTDVILQGAGRLIAHNKSHLPGQLVAHILDGEKIHRYQAPTPEAEAEFVVQKIEELIGGISHFSFASHRAHGSDQAETAEALTFRNFAVLYRTSGQAACLDEAFARSGMPYQIVGGSWLWKNPGMKLWRMLLSGIAHTWQDFEAKQVIAAIPGIGDRSLEKLQQYLESCHGHWTELALLAQTPGIATKACQALQSFRETMGDWRATLAQASLDKLFAQIKTQIAWPDWQLDEAQWTVWQQLAGRFTDLRQLLAYTLLQRQPDEIDTKSEKIKLLTLHAAKGLEFSIVFIVGCEDGLLPFTKMEKPDADSVLADTLEAERRLLYVGMTRAKARLYLVYSKSRTIYGKKQSQSPSPYLAEIPGQLLVEDHVVWKKSSKKTTAGEQMSFF